MDPLITIMLIGRTTDMFASVLVICACIIGVVVVFGII